MDTKLTIEKEYEILNECLIYNNCEELIQQYWNLINKIVCSKYQYSKSGNLEEERKVIKQNVVVRLFDKNKKRLRQWKKDGGSSLSSWIGLITDQTVTDYIRKKNRKGTIKPKKSKSDDNTKSESIDYKIKFVSLTEELDLLSDDKNFEKINNKDLIKKLFKILPEKPHRFIMKFKLKGYSSKEIGDMLSISEKEINYKRHDSILILKEYINKNEYV